MKTKLKKYTKPETKGSSKWWIAIIVVVALIIIGIIGYCIYKSKSKKNNVDPLLGN